MQVIVNSKWLNSFSCVRPERYRFNRVVKSVPIKFHLTSDTFHPLVRDERLAMQTQRLLNSFWLFVIFKTFSQAMQALVNVLSETMSILIDCICVAKFFPSSTCWHELEGKVAHVRDIKDSQTKTRAVSCKNANATDWKITFIQVMFFTKACICQ